MRAPTVSEYYMIKERATHSAMAQRKLAAKCTPGRNPTFIPFRNQRPNFNNRNFSNNLQRQYNLSNALPSMNNTPVPMDLGRTKSRNDWWVQGRGNPQGQWRGRANVANASQRGTFNCFSCGKEGHYAKNCPRCQGKGRIGAKANLINFDAEEDTLYEGSQAKGSRVALVKIEMEAMSFNERQELIKELAGEEDKDFHSA
jgi:hypothetical protein